MPQNVKIDGGIPIGAPQDWDPEKHGQCGTLDVLVREGERGWPELVTAYRFTPAEMDVIAKGEGNLFLCIVGASHPVISMWIQNGQEPVGDGIQTGDAPDLLRAANSAIIEAQDDVLQAAWQAMVAELEAQAEQRTNAPDIGDPDPVGQIYMNGVFGLKAGLQVALEAAGKQLQANRQPQGHTLDLPVMTLQSVAAEAQVAEALSGGGKPTPSADFEAGRNEAIRQYELVSAEELVQALDGYDRDPPDTDYQRGHLRGLRETCFDAGVIDRLGNRTGFGEAKSEGDE